MLVGIVAPKSRMQVQAPYPALQSRTLFLTNLPSVPAYNGLQQANAAVYGYCFILKCILVFAVANFKSSISYYTPTIRINSST